MIDGRLRKRIKNIEPTQALCASQGDPLLMDQVETPQKQAHALPGMITRNNGMFNSFAQPLLDLHH